MRLNRIALALALAAVSLASGPLASAAVTTAAGQSPTAAIARQARARRAVPQGFVGVDADGPLFAPGSTLDFGRQTATMVANGVQSIRVAFSWSAAQPYAGWSSVPAAARADFTNVAGRPTDFRTSDVIVGDAARRRLSVLPTVLYAPSWDAVANPAGVATPRQSAPYAAYLTALIGRYGPHGSFWQQNPQLPRMPIRMWQIWNEPDLAYYWRQPFAASYVSLVSAARAAMKRADPGAKVVLGALTNLAWRSLGQVYRIPGARRLFDVVAVNGFTRTPADVILYLRFVRAAMDRFKDQAKPLIATEISWPSAKGQTASRYDFDTTEAGQARNLATLLPLLGAQRASLGLAGFYYYTWVGAEIRGTQAFNFSGLLRFAGGRVMAKPALTAFRRGALALERCARKGAVATSCVR